MLSYFYLLTIQIIILSLHMQNTKASGNCINCCSARRSFVMLSHTQSTQQLTLTSTHVLFRPYSYFVPASTVLIFPDELSNICLTKYTAGFKQSVYGKVVLVKLLDKFLSWCPVEQWVSNMQKLGARGVLLWNLDRSDLIFNIRASHKFNSTALRIPTRMLSYSSGFKIYSTAKENVMRASFSCYSDRSADKICIRDIGDGSSWQIDGTYQLLVKRTVNQHKVWTKGDNHVLWLHVDGSNGWLWVISRRIGSVPENHNFYSLANRLNYVADAFCNVTNAKSDKRDNPFDACKNTNWMVYYNHFSYRNLGIENRVLGWHTTKHITLSTNVCKVGQNFICIQGVGSYEQVHSNVPKWYQATISNSTSSSTLSQNNQKSMLVWDRIYSKNGRRYWGWKLIQLASGYMDYYGHRTVAICPFFDISLYGWSDFRANGQINKNKYASQIILKPWLCTKWSIIQKSNKSIELDVDSGTCNQNRIDERNAIKNYDFPDQFCWNNKNDPTSHHIFQRFFGIWYKNGLLVSGRPVYMFENTKHEHLYMVYNRIADTWLVVNSINSDIRHGSKKIIEKHLLFECDSKHAISPIECQKGWIYHVYKFTTFTLKPILKSTDVNNCFISRKKYLSQPANFIKYKNFLNGFIGSCINFPYKRLKHNLKWQNINAHDASGIYYKNKQSYDIYQTKYNRNTNIAQYEIYYDKINRYWRLKINKIINNNKQNTLNLIDNNNLNSTSNNIFLAYCTDIYAYTPFQCKQWYSENLDQYSFIYNLTKSIRFSNCISKICITNTNQNNLNQNNKITTPYQYLYGQWDLYQGDKVKSQNKAIYYNKRLAHHGLYPLYMIYIKNHWYITHELELISNSPDTIISQNKFVGYCNSKIDKNGKGDIENPTDCPTDKWIIMDHYSLYFFVNDLSKMSTTKDNANHKCFESEKANFPIYNQTVPRHICGLFGHEKTHTEKILSGLWNINMHKFNNRHYWYKDVCIDKHHHHHKMHHTDHKHHHHKHHPHHHHHHKHHHSQYKHTRRRLIEISNVEENNQNLNRRELIEPAHHHHHHHHKHHPKHKHHHHHHHAHHEIINHKNKNNKCKRYYMYYNEMRRFWVIDNVMSSNFIHPQIYCPNHTTYSPHTCQNWYGYNDESLLIRTRKTYRLHNCQKQLETGIFHKHHHHHHHKSYGQSLMDEINSNTDSWATVIIAALLTTIVLILLCCCLYKLCIKYRDRKNNINVIAKITNANSSSKIKPGKKKNGYELTDNENNTEDDSDEESKIRNSNFQFGKPKHSPKNTRKFSEIELNPQQKALNEKYDDDNSDSEFLNNKHDGQISPVSPNNLALSMPANNINEDNDQDNQFKVNDPLDDSDDSRNPDDDDKFNEETNAVKNKIAKLKMNNKTVKHVTTPSNLIQAVSPTVDANQQPNAIDSDFAQVDN